ncbi:phytase [Roseateles sp. DAIF2]|uniref:phytase n=1 Tax=Roseateles sp. DAIF2 TaxID=2714952 RepID=UPI0018A33743|nr:phytase [Roseateles sp. DAIF2]QPF76169.1 phytase [Roseateles sp. DAIF2]
MKHWTRALCCALGLLLAGTAVRAEQQPQLSLDKGRGLLLQDAQGRELDRLALRAKRWDRRGDLALLQDADSGELRLLRAAGGRLRPEGRWAGPGFAVEQLCLFRDGQDLLHVFLLGEDGRSEQWLLHEGRARPERLLATPPEPGACRVRDGEARLYIAEPGVGLWAYEADAEREGRRLIAHAPQVDAAALVRRLDDWLAAHPAPAAAPALPLLAPSAQTRPMRSQGDAADDPAIWVHGRRPAASLILGTDKKRGLAVYDLQGRERQFLPVGRVNNVDLRQGLRYGGARRLDLAVASQRDEAGLVLFGIGAEGRVTELARLPTGLDEIYGLCVGRNEVGGLDIFPNDKDGRVLQLRLRRMGAVWRTERLREIRLASQPEGCVVDEAQGLLFVGEEKRGVWRLALGDPRAEPALAVPLGPTLAADVEGLAIYAGRQGRYLLVSSQGSDSYALFDAAPPHAPRGAFRIGIHARLGIDGASETDGLELTAANLGGVYARGLLVVQDGRKRLPQGPQNFKLLPWRAVAEALDLP